MPEDDNNFWTEIFQRELRDSDDPAAMMAAGGRGGKPGVLLFRGWGSGKPHRRQAAGRRWHPIKTDIDDAPQEARARLSVPARRRGFAKAGQSAVAIRGNPKNLGPEVPRHFLSMLSEGRPEAFQQGQRPAGTGRRHRQAADRHAGDRQPHLEGPLRHRHRRYAEQLRHERRAAHQSRVTGISGDAVREERHVDQEAASRDHAELGLSAQHRERRRRISPRIPATGSTGASIASAWMPNSCAIPC